MKRVISLLLVLSLVFTLGACSKSDEKAPEENANSGETVSTTAENKLEKIKETGILILGTSADYPPFEFHINEDGKDEIAGFEIEFAKLLAEDLGVKLEIQDMDFNAVLTGIESGMFDIALSGINPSPERAKVMDFSDVFYEAEYTVVVRAGEEDDFQSTDDLNGIGLGVQTGTLQEDVANENFDSNIVSLGKVTDLVLQLQSGMIDAIILEVPVAQSYMANNDDIAVAEKITFDDVEIEGGVVAAFSKGQDELREYVNGKIQEFKAEGLFDKLYQEAVELNDSQQQ